MVPKYALGGIGDLLLNLQSAKEEEIIDIYSHYKEASDIFTQFGIKIGSFIYCEKIEDFSSIYNVGEPLRKDLHPVFVMPDSPFPKSNKKVVGIHIEGSQASNDFWKKRGQPLKNMPKIFLEKLVLAVRDKYPEVEFYIFCSPNTSQTKLIEIDDASVKIIAYPKIWDSLSCVAHCDYVIGMDSCIKSLSAILFIPTLTFVGNYNDDYRDALFLTPYEQEGIMKVYRFNNIENTDPKMIVENIFL